MSASRSSVDDYIRNHRLEDLFSHVSAIMINEQPENPQTRILQELKRIHADKSSDSRPPKYSGLMLNQDELNAIFNGLDQENVGSISGEEARVAFRTILTSNEDVEGIDMIEIPKYVDRSVFIQLAHNLTHSNHDGHNP